MSGREEEWGGINPQERAPEPSEVGLNQPLTIASDEGEVEGGRPVEWASSYTFPSNPEIGGTKKGKEANISTNRTNRSKKG